MNKLIFILLSFFFARVNAQILICEDFKSGTFTMTSEDPLDSLEIELIRTENSQIETLEVNGEKIKLYATIKWINNCAYILKFDELKMQLNGFQKSVNDNTGIVVKMEKIENNCFYYRSVLIIDGDEPEIIKGKLCKISI